MMAGMDTWSAGEASVRRSSRAFAPHDKLWEQMIQSIREECHHDFTSLAEMSRILRTAIYSLWNNESKQQFVVFLKFRHTTLANFDNNVEGRRHCKVSYMNDILIVRIMPSVKHEEGAMRFNLLIYQKLSVMGIQWRTLRPTGAAHVLSSTGAGSKEADLSYVPQTRSGDVPSVVVEVGVSESLLNLRQDAEWWLMNTDGKTRLVFLISIDVNTHAIHLETWIKNPTPPAFPFPPVQIQGRRPSREEQNQLREQRQMSMALATSIPMKSFEIDITQVGQNSHNDNLVIPWQLVWDDYPGPGPTQDIIFSTQDFIEFADSVW